ncbi:hypothetical protein KIW84_071765 [Lathyrus oleraceus]|uniref:Uncharacterized protein n=1 Tax=Pisum sativum TaxID=3888 RepID=A0A9D4VKA7_PEA|nr:hypothetical protein KIW84_071765 [Pisum sativum]
MKNNPRHSWKRDEEVKFCLKPAKIHIIRLILHYKGELVYSLVKCFSKALRSLKCDVDVIKVNEDLSGFDLVDLYVEHEAHNPDIIYEAEAVRGFDVDDDVEVNNDKEDDVLVYDDVEANNDKEDNIVVDDDLEVNNDKEDNVVVDDDVKVNNDKEDNDDTNADYVGSGGSWESNIDISADSIDLDCKIVLHTEIETTWA